MKSFDPGGSTSDQEEPRGWRAKDDLDADALLFPSKDDCEGDGYEGGDGCEGRLGGGGGGCLIQ